MKSGTSIPLYAKRQVRTPPMPLLPSSPGPTECLHKGRWQEEGAVLPSTRWWLENTPPHTCISTSTIGLQESHPALRETQKFAIKGTGMPGVHVHSRFNKANRVRGTRIVPCRVLVQKSSRNLAEEAVTKQACTLVTCVSVTTFSQRGWELTTPFKESYIYRKPKRHVLHIPDT